MNAEELHALQHLFDHLSSLRQPLNCGLTEVPAIIATDNDLKLRSGILNFMIDGRIVGTMVKVRNGHVLPIGAESEMPMFNVDVQGTGMTAEAEDQEKNENGLSHRWTALNQDRTHSTP